MRAIIRTAGRVRLRRHQRADGRSIKWLHDASRRVVASVHRRVQVGIATADGLNRDAAGRKRRADSASAAGDDIALAVGDDLRLLTFLKLLRGNELRLLCGRQVGHFRVRCNAECLGNPIGVVGRIAIVIDPARCPRLDRLSECHILVGRERVFRVVAEQPLLRCGLTASEVREHG